MRTASISLLLLLFAACGPQAAGAHVGPPAGPARDGPAFLIDTLRPWPHADSTGLLAMTDPATGRVATYDSALVVLVLLRKSQRERAGRVLQGLAALQWEDGSFPFSFRLPAPDPGARYDRAGAIAWIGYAAAEYLDAERGGAARDVALSLAHRAARYLIAHQVAHTGDPRDGLVLGGRGTLRYEVDAGAVREVLEPGEVAWTSVEHNVDAYFFLRAIARVSGIRAYADAANRIARTLVERAWSSTWGQFVEGIGTEGTDETLALDCASWGSVLLGAIGDGARADTSFAVADARYSSHDAVSGVRGHRPYERGPLIADERVREHIARTLPAARWERLDVVWPEGGAGVALAAWRAGRADRARAILDSLETLRARDGSLPTSTIDVPFVLDTRPSIAGTAWVFLVRFEMQRPLERPTLWAP